MTQTQRSSVRLSPGQKPFVRQAQRPTVAVFNKVLYGNVHGSEWLGAVDAAESYDINLLALPGEELDNPQDFLAQANILYDLVNAQNVDGLLIFTEALNPHVTSATMEAFVRRFAPLPIICMEVTFEGIPGILVDNYASMRHVLAHLLEVHGYRRIAFMRGPSEHVGAQERYRAYTEMLVEYGLPVDPALVTPPNSWWDTGAAEAAIRLFFDERQLRPRQDIEVIVTAGDIFGIFALHALKARGINVPHEVAVTGFDDFEDARNTTPPLTTVRPPFYDLGWQGIALMAAHFAGQAIPSWTTVPALLQVRQSCGCQSRMVCTAAASINPSPPEPLATWPPDRRLEMITIIAQSLPLPTLAETLAAQIFDGFVTELLAASSGSFLRAIQETLRCLNAARRDVLTCQNALSALRQGVLPALRDDVDRFVRAENLWHQARVMIGETAQAVQAYQRVQAEQQVRDLHAVEAALLTTFDLAELMQVLADKLPPLGFSGIYLNLYEDPQHPLEWSRLMLAYYAQGRIALEPEGCRFPTCDVLPAGLWPATRRLSLVVEPLFFREHQLGFIVFEAPLRDGMLFDSLSRQISNALQGALLVRQMQARSAELAREQYIFNAFMETLPDMLFFKDCDGRIIRANRAHARGVGLTDPAEEIGKTYFDLMSEELARFAHEEEQQILRTGEPVFNRESMVTLPDGRLMCSLLTKMPVRDEHGTMIGTFGISRDITHLKKIEAALQEAKDAAEAANRAKSEFLANMSHELRTPLNGILGYAQILQHDPSLSARQQEGMSIIQHSGEHLLTLINDILDLAKIEARKFELFPTEFNLPEFLDQIAGIIRMQAHAKRLRFQYAPAPGLPAHVYSDERRLRQVVLNLLGNAVKFTEPGGTVTLKIEHCQLNLEKHDAPPQSSIVNLQFSIADTGVGLTPEQLTLIFRPFEQVGNPQKRVSGTGLGLAISRQLVRLMGSDIQVHSVFGQGSTFWFDLTLPVVLKESRTSLSRPRMISGYQGRPRRVLIVDNEATNRWVLRDLLQPLGFACLEAENGQEALQVARMQPPDLILLDLLMPVMNGFETLQHLRQDHVFADVVVIAVSASAFDADQAHSLAAGCQAFLPKPVEAQQLLDLLETHLNLTWQYQERDERNAVEPSSGVMPEFAWTPTQADLQHLRELTLKGDLFGLQHYAAALQQRDARVQPFAAELVRLAEAYQDEQLLTLIEHYLEQKA